MKKIKISIATLMLFTLANAEIINVPSDYSKIQQAINASSNGDTVLVQPGTYVENINFGGKSIVLGSLFIINGDKEYITKTILDGGSPPDPDYGSTVKIMSGESPVIAGFTITKGIGTVMPGGGWMEGGGIVIDNGSSPVIRNNIIIKNNAIERKGITSRGGGGISSMASNPTIINNIIISNTAAYAGGIVLNWSGGTIKNNIIYNNTAIGGIGSGGVMIWDKPSNAGVSQIIENNTIVGNYSASITGGMSIDGEANPVSKNNIIWGNRQAIGKQIVLNKYGKHQYSDIEDGDESEFCIDYYPDFLLDTMFLLNETSHCIDSGDAYGAYNDVQDPVNINKAKSPSYGKLRNDIGAYGGPNAINLPVINLESIFYNKLNFGNLKPGKEIIKKIEIGNFGTDKLTLDSIKITHHSKNLQVLESFVNKTLLPLQFITAEIKLTPIDSLINDTLFVFHSFKSIENPIKILIKGVSSLKDNVACWGKATASTDQGVNYSPAYAIDGMASTRWQSIGQNNQWLKIELDTTYVLGKVVIDWETAYGKKYRVQTSKDGINWNTVYYEGNSDGGQDILLFSPDTARFVKLDCIELATQWGFSTYEVKIFVTDGKNYPVHSDINNPLQLKDFVTNYPNPVGDYTIFDYKLSEAAEVNLSIFTLSGKLLETIVDENQQPGSYRVKWMAVQLKPGIYLYKLTNGQHESVNKLIVIR